MRSLAYIVVGLLTALLPAIKALALHSAPQIPLANSEAAFSWVDDKDGFVRDELFEFDIDWVHGSKDLLIHEDVDTLAVSNITGDVNIVAGDFTQDRDVIILVRIRSSNATVLDYIFARAEDQKLLIGSNYEDESGVESAHITVTLFVRPHCLQMGNKETSVHTTNLDINIWPGLWFETYHMVLTSLYGSITGSEITTFTAHEIGVRALNGNIVGNWSLPALIRLETETGNIDIDLIPKRWSSGPTTRGDVYAEAHQGDISIRMPFEQDKLSLRNGTTTIRCDLGMVMGNLVHSGQTKILSSGYSLINVTLLPYWSFYEWQGMQYNYLTTDQFAGTTDLRILPPVIESYFPVNPLCLMKSHHKTTNGRINLSYPREWCGTATGNVTRFDGYVKVTGEDYEVVVEDPRNVVVQRIPLGSNLDFEIGGGLASLELR